MPVISQFPKVCPCCGASYSWLSWTALPYLGTATYADTTIELRNCPCGDTLSIEVGWAGQEREAVLEGGPGEHLCDAREPRVV